MNKMSYSTSLYDKINFFYIAANLNDPGGYQDGVWKFQKHFLTFLGLGTNVVKVSSVNPKLLFQLDTLAKALQFWVEKAQPPLLGQPCQLAECVWELREFMDLLTLFTDEEVLTNDDLSYWVKITSSRPSKPTEPEATREWSHSRSRRACHQGSFPVTHGMEQSKPATATPTASSLTISSQRVKTPFGSPIIQNQKPYPVLQR